MTPEDIEEAVLTADQEMAWWAARLDGHLQLHEPDIALVWCEFQPVYRHALVALARAGLEPARALLLDMAEFLTVIGDRLPMWLQEYVVWPRTRFQETGGAAPPRDPLANLVRDFLVAQAVELVSQKFGLRPTRNPATRDIGSVESGCSIVARALEPMSEDNVVAIWRKANKGLLTQQGGARAVALKALSSLRRTDQLGHDGDPWLRRAR